MYGIYTNIGGILMVNVTIYSIHGPYGVYTNHQHLRIRISRSPSDKHHKKTYHKKMRFPGPGPSHPSRDVRLLSESPKVGQCQTRHVQLWEKREPASFLRPPKNAVYVAENLWPGTAHTCKGHKRTRTANFPKERKTA